MRTVPTFTFSILTLASLEAAAALSATVPPAWLKAEVSLPEHSRSPLVVKLSPDMTPCRAKYGNEAASKCSRLFGLVSSRVTGVSLSPAVEGVWRWEARGALAFTPEEPWPERTTFKVDLSGLRLPSATTLNTPVIDFTTPPLTMTSGFATFWMDPAVSGERALTVDALFSTTIADTKAFEASVKVDVPSRSGLTFGKPVFIWNHFRTGFYMKLPVRTLGNATNVRITFPKAAGKWTAADGRHPVVQPGFRQAFVSYTIPAADSLYKMGEASLSPTRTETLEQVYELVLRPSLLTKPSDIVAAMRVTALPARMNEEAVSPTDWRRAPAVTPDVLARGTPVTLRITDATGRTMLETAPALTPEGTASADWSIPTDAVPGEIRIDLLAGDVVLSTHHAAIGDFTPEAMRLTARMVQGAPGWMKPGDLGIDATLAMSYGAPAAKKAMRARLVLSPARDISFPELPGWTFVDPAPFEGTLDEVKVKSVETDAAGRASLTLPLSSTAGTLKGRLLLEGFENGGIRAATENVDFLISPADTMLGWRRHAESTVRKGGVDMPAPEAFSWITRDEERTFEFLLVDRFLKPCADRPLTLAVMARQSVTELASDSTGRLRYDERSVERPVRESAVTTDANGRTTASLNTSAPGDFSLVVKDEQGRVLARLPYHVAGEDLRPALSGDLPAATAKLVSDKSTYEAGEFARLDIVSPFEGLALVTLEADRVLVSKWVKVSAGTNAAQMEVPEGYSGRAFLSASLVRSSKDAARFLKAYARATAPVTLNMKPRTLGVKLEAPAVVPDTRELKVTVKSDAPGRVFLWAVDTGILSLTGYRTPSPVHALLEDRGLQVDTRQTLEGLMPEGMKLPGEAPFGGGFGSRAISADAMANPFRRTMDRAAVWWAGSLETDEKGRTVTVSLPSEFNGGVRLMAVGASEGRVGGASIDTAVRAPFILTPILPGFAAPGDVFTGVVSLNGEAPWKGSVALGLPEGLSAGVLSAPLVLEAPGEATARFDIAAGAVPGAASITVTATPEKGSAVTRTTSFSIRPAALRTHDVLWGPLADVKTADVTVKARLLPLENETSLTVSTTPLPLAHGLVRSLPEAFWLSSDAALSAAMPWAQLVGAPAAKLPAGDADALRRDATARIQKALDTIEGQLGWNGLSAWPWGSPSLMATTWALDFVLTLRENGRDVRPELVRRLADAISNALDGLTPDTLGQARTAAWALAQLTREGTLEAERIEALRNRMDARELDWRNDPAALYIAYAYRLMRLTDEADELQKAAISIDVSKSEGNDTLTLGGIPALASAVRLAPTPEGTAHLLQTLESRPLASLTDRERAFLASALLSAPSNGAHAGKLDAVTLACTAPAAEKRPAESLAKGDGFVTLSAPGCTAFRLSSAASLKGLYHSTTAAGWPAEPHKTASYEGLEVVKRILNEAGEPVTSVKAGDVVTVEIRARRTSGNAESPVVITDLFPGGFAPASTDKSLQGVDVRQTAVSEDRMVGVCMLEHQESTFTYRLRAQTHGKYTVPAVQAADGADPTIKAHDKSLTLTVTP